MGIPQPFDVLLASSGEDYYFKRSDEDRDYLDFKLDDPIFNAPIYANLFDDEDGEGFSLIWSRLSRRSGE